MLMSILAAAAPMAVTAPDAGFTPASWDKKPTAAELQAVWPPKAFALRRGGRAILRCRVNIHGGTEACTVVSESPVGEGFGAAALLLTPQLLFKPATRGGEPVASEISVPITFEGDPAPVLTPPAPTPTVTMVGRPVWAAAPTFADAAAAFPARVAVGSGYVALRCFVRRDGSLKDCDVLRAEPAGRGFEGAARKLASRFRLLMPDRSAAMDRDPLVVDVPFRFIDPSGPAATPRRVVGPIWLATPDSDTVRALFPASARAKDLRAGRGVITCTVTAQGGLADCAPLPGDPDGVGFSEAAVKAAAAMRMNLWTGDGGPVDGARIELPIRFKLEDDEPAITPPPLAGGGAAETDLTRRDLVTVRQPTVEDVTRVYPAEAIRKNAGGGASVRCTILLNGAVSDCSVTDETPPGWGFGYAAMSLATCFRFEPIGRDGKSVVGRRVLLPIRFAPALAPNAPP